MTIEIFTKKQFENALPVNKYTGAPLWSCMGFVRGTWQYLIKIDDVKNIEPVGAQIGILIQSTVARNGISKDVAEDSIRLWLVEFWGEFRPGGEMGTWSEMPISVKTLRWITRQPGWQKRLDLSIRQLWYMRKAAGNCPGCGKPKLIAKSKKRNENFGRMFATCRSIPNCPNSFEWIELDSEKIKRNNEEKFK